MGRLVARPRKMSHDFTVVDNVPRAIVALSVGLGPDDGNGGTHEHRAFLQFPIRIPASATVSSATLRVVIKGSGPPAASGAVHAVALWSDSSVTPDSAWTAASLASVSASWPLMAEGVVVEFTVTPLIQAAIAHGGYVNGIVTLRLQSDATITFGALYAADDQWISSPRLTVDFEWTETDVDPYTLALDALWSLLESNVHFAALVPPSNRIRIDGSSRDPHRDTVSEGDMPEVMILLDGGAPHEKATSTSAFDAARYRIYVSTGDQRPNFSWHKVRWAIFRALANWTPDIFDMVKWKGNRAIVQVTQNEVAESLDEADQNRGIRGWACVWECELMLSFAESDLL